MPREAFGKFRAGEPLQIRDFEAQLGIDGRDSWKSNTQSVKRLLDHLLRYTKSEASREKYLRHLLQFSRFCGLGPEELTRLPKKEAEQLVQAFADGLAEKGRSRAYVNSATKRIKTFYRANGYIGSREMRIHGYFVPARYRKVPEYIPSKSEVHSIADASGNLEDRAIILTLWSSGLRVSTLCALNYGDIASGLVNDEPFIMMPVSPEMKLRVPDAAKGLVSYYTFICPEASGALRSYLKDREEKYGQIQHDDPLFYSDWTLWRTEERSSKRLGRRGVGLIVKRAARHAGITQWMHVTPHCLRKAFESVLRSPTVDGGRMDKGTQEFLFGHILPGTQDPYYDRTKIDYHREEYSKLDFGQTGTGSRMVDKLIDIEELEENLRSGCLFIAKVSDRTIIVRKRGA